MNCIRCKKETSGSALCPDCTAAPLTNIETPHAMPAAGVTIEPYAGGPCWIVRDANGAESLLTADRTSAELHAERLRIMGGTWKTAEQLCDTIMEQRRQQPAAEPDPMEVLREVLRVLVTPAGLPDKGKGRTDEQQAALNAARAVLASKGGTK